jgi:hypothetical protein
MNDKEQCKQLEIVAYKSCVDSYFRSKDQNDIYEYWLQLLEAKRSCEARGVHKALELISLYNEINGESKENNNNKEL